MLLTELTQILFAQITAPAVATDDLEFSFWKIMFHGGAFAKIVMFVVLALGVFSLYLFFERFFFIKRLTSKTDANFMENIEDFIKEGKIESAADYAKKQNSPEGRILEKGISRLGRPVSDIVSAMESQAQIEVANMEKNLNLLAVVPSIAPMLGLLGTVIGMIIAFFNLSHATGSFSPKTLSEGIYTALGQTAVGLAVAIPANFFYNILLTRIDRFVLKAQNMSGEFLDLINKPL
ncbi:MULTISPECIES: MotA/TolQ/ExbB proton channel family protein [unclassified Chryseobacterium]|uniref:MotA/TolQ/ExbB proton channel family protein n=1 Tax=unclassified Chryseobacterium TaxID=2593645 RepID=UPI0004E7B55C|nr:MULTISPECIES: MotA/TolQ/ExbB proton channel family protein [unclassified Chryseobacterium]KFF22446.1 biopolymer transporter ExbB [Chryseobacterium sp. JM1]SHG27286.1 biopolymer transport protein ExbB [Chryseobacterium sp. OV279]HCA08821.1 MotA/TolQ/ExbB proton channel family protein [Chryseobacterium sp.]